MPSSDIRQEYLQDQGALVRPDPAQWMEDDRID